MRKVLLSIAALTLLATPALSQTVTSGSVSGAVSGSNLTFSPTTIARSGIPGGGSAIGATMQSQFGCENITAVQIPWGGVGIPTESRTACPTQAIATYKECTAMKNPRERAVCIAILAQNPYARPALVQMGEVMEAPAGYQAQRVIQAAPVAYANTKARPAAGNGDFCSNPATYSPALCSGR